MALFWIIGATVATLSWTEPPRFDGAGYATLGRALAEGRGYRVISLVGSPLHAHFPPAYPTALALVWLLVGTADQARFTILAHALSVGLMALGVWSVGRWWRWTEPRGVATCLTLALAVNWTWARTGGLIRSEPLAIALGGLSLLVARRVARSDRLTLGLIGLSLLLGLGVLTRQVAACWSLAVAVDLGLRRGWRAAGGLLVGIGLVVAPWVGWQVWVGSGTQSGLFQVGDLPRIVASQTVFYARRIPDVIVGPFVEVATVFGRSAWLGRVATVGAVAVACLVVLGWVRSGMSQRRRLGGLIPLLTLPLLLVWPFTEAGRFLVPLVPFVLMGAVEGGASLLGRLGVPRAKLWASRLVLAGSIPYAAYAVVSNRAGAERQLQRDFDAGCAWIASQTEPAGPVMAQHAVDVAWMTGRLGVAIPDGGMAEIVATIRRDHVAFFIIDDHRFARSPDNPLRALVNGSVRVEPVWRAGSTAVYRVNNQKLKPIEP